VVRVLLLLLLRLSLQDAGLLATATAPADLKHLLPA
jgi:hypothetical protein